MKLLEYSFNSKTRGTKFSIFPIGDTHVGASNCAEDKLIKLVARIRDDPQAFWIGGGDLCMPMDTRILTKGGFKRYDEVAVGEKVAGFDGTKVVWTSLRGVYLAGEVKFNRLKTSMFDAVCSNNHGWVVHDGHRARRNGQESAAHKVATKDLRQGHRIIVAAAGLQQKGDLAITDDEASLLGWIITDGSTSKHSNRKNCYRTCILQAKEPYKTAIRERLSQFFTSERPRRLVPGELLMSVFYCSAPQLNEICARLGVSVQNLRKDLHKVVGRLSSSAQVAMFQSMLDAEGWKEKGRWRWSQSNKNQGVIETFQVLAALTGKRLTKMSFRQDGVGTCTVVSRGSHVCVADLKIQPAGSGPAWCPVTKTGNWVCLQSNGQVTITGNCDAVVLNDAKRFDPTVLPDWMLDHQGADAVRKNLSDMLDAQAKRFYKLFDPIRHKCIGLIEGNHEYSIMKHHNRDFLKDMCRHFNVPDLTDCAFLRFRFNRESPDSTRVSTVRMFISHGHGGGRTSGAEPNILYRLAADKECDIVLKGHSHTFCIHPPIPVLTIPSGGKMPDDPLVSDKFAANWGSFLYTYKSGPSTYASRANYPVRPMYTVQCTIHPHPSSSSCGSHTIQRPQIELNPVRL